ncbi:MAG TPA: magnesium transporter [Firmicutes bacterium]|nr:magnesium transporter [Bacillota bacterium]
MEKYIANLMEMGKLVEARNKIVELNEVDIARLLENLEEDKALMIFRLLPKDLAVSVFSYMTSAQQEFIIASIADREIRNIVDNLFLDDTVDLLEEMPANIVKKILKNTSEGRRKLINQFLKYPENSAGSLMTIEFVDLKKEMTVKEALEHIRETGIDKETLDICYVIDQSRILEGVIPLRKLVLGEESAIIDDIMDTNIITIRTHDDQEEIASLFKKYDLLAVPVVDNERRLVGIITIDDIVDIIEEENTEDFQKMAAMAPLAEEYLETNIFVLAKHRIIWLLILMVSATFTGNIIRKYEEVLSSVVLLAAFIPMLMDTGGNAGSQSATLIIRGIALEEIGVKDLAKVIWKELRVSILVGLVLAAVNFVRIFYFERVDIRIALTVCISLFLTVVMAKIVGGALPILAKKIRLDPAIMASPLITTIVDAVALVAYFSIASRLLLI